jgi:hypothetical protein
MRPCMVVSSRAPVVGQHRQHDLPVAAGAGNVIGDFGPALLELGRLRARTVVDDEIVPGIEQRPAIAWPIRPRPMNPTFMMWFSLLL